MSKDYYIGLTDEDYDNWRVVGVFSSEKLAQEAIDKYWLEHYGYNSKDDNSMIIKCKLNEYLKNGGFG